MNSIKNNLENEIIIKNSRFITNLYKINNIKEIELYLNQIKEKYKDANHNCYAYIYENTKKSSDDKEPSGTAGTPLLQTLEKRNLSNILVIVTRYFGGIKLGAPGLVRAYTTSLTQALDKAEIITLEKGYNIDITLNYEDTKKIDYLLKDINIINKEYKETIKYNLNIDNNTLNKLNQEKNINIKIKEEIYIEKNNN